MLPRPPSSTPFPYTTLFRSATLTGAGSLTIVSGGTLNITGFGTRFIDGGTINKSHVCNRVADHNLTIANSGNINNQVGGVFRLTNDQLIFQHCCSAGEAFNN